MPRWMHQSKTSVGVVTIMTVVALIALTPAIIAQERRVGSSRTAPVRHAQTDSGVVTINYPDAVSLSAFVDYVSQTLDIRIIYGDEVKSQTIVFRPEEVEVPKDQLVHLLRGMLRMRDLALVESHIDGWMRIVRTDDMQRHIREIRKEWRQPDVPTSNQVVTQVLTIASADMSAVVKYAKSFLSSSKASVIEIPNKKMIIITDYESAVAKAIEIIKLIDTAPISAQIVTVPIKRHDAQAIATQVLKVLTNKAKLEGTAEPRITIDSDETSGSILLIGSAGVVAEAEALIARFDVAAHTHRPTRVYAPRYISADRLQRIIEGVLAPGASEQGAVKLFLDEQVNRLYVTGPPEVHADIEGFLQAEDIESLEAARPLRIYKPQNRLASDLMNVLSEVLPNITTRSLQASQVGPASSAQQPRVPPGRNRPPAAPGPGQRLPMPPAQEADAVSEPSPEQVARIEGEDFIMSYDEHTNSIIAIGPREFHFKLQMLMKELDKRQAQVLIEVTLVAMTFNDSFSLGVELANEERWRSGGDYQSLLFSSFGLSGIDLATGMRTFSPGGGLNGIILGPHETPILIRAIAAHGDSRVITTPRIIVTDNTTGSIQSVEESPFTSVNASDTVATTSFAGFESAGTTLTVTPHVSAAGHLSLDYSLNFSNFTGEGSGGVPPPRTTNSFSGTVDIPDGYTIIVGGLVTDNESDSVTEIPILGRIPVIGVLFQSSSRARTKFRVYAFIRPTILRDDQFKDLKMISQREMQRAELANRDFPESQLLWMR